MNIFYCIDACTTCRAARKDLEARGIEAEYRDLKTSPPDRTELEAWIGAHPKGIAAFFNTSGILYREYNMKEKRRQLSEKELVGLLSKEGMLLKRPLLVTPNGVLTGYSPAAYAAFFAE